MGKEQAAHEQNGNCQGLSFLLGDGPKMVCSQALGANRKNCVAQCTDELSKTTCMAHISLQ